MTITNQGIAAATALVPLPFPGAAELDSIRNAGTLAARSTALRDCFVGKPENCFIALMFARDMQIPPMLALTRGFVIKGSFDLDTEIKLDIVMSRIPGFDYKVLELTNDRCRIEGGIAGRNPFVVEFTAEQGRKAKLDGYAADAPYVQDKLLWRCISRLIRRTGAGRAYMMLGSLTAEPESDEGGATSERSGAVVVEEGGLSSGAQVSPEPTTPPATSREAETLIVGPPVDPLARLARAIAKHYGMKEPQGPHFGRWMKANEKLALQAINLWADSRGEAPFPRMLAFPPMDRDRVAEWLEKHAEKRAGKAAVADNGEAASTDAPGQESGPASLSSEIAEPMNAEPLEDDAPVEPGGARLAALGLDRVVEVLLALKDAHTKPGRPRDFIQKSALSKRWMLVDSEILVTCGYTNEAGAPLSQWLDRLASSEGAWLTVCNAIYEIAVGAKVDLFREVPA